MKRKVKPVPIKYIDSGAVEIDLPDDPPQLDIDTILVGLMTGLDTDNLPPNVTVSAPSLDLVKAKQAIYEIGLECIGADETLKTQSEYDKQFFGHPEADAMPNLQYVRQATRNQLRAAQRKAWAKACGVDNG